MAKIRSVTLFSEPSIDEAKVEAFFTSARSTLPREVQTVRLATTPFPTWWQLGHFTTIQVEERLQPWLDAGAEFVSFGPVCLRHDAGWLNNIPDLLACCDQVFVAAEIADSQGLIDIGRCRSVAEVIRRLSMLRADGLANLQFSALANCPSNIPYFPTAYHRGGSPSFGIAMEAAKLVFDAIQGIQSLAEARKAIIEVVEDEAEAIAEAAAVLAAEHDLRFEGIDFSLAPFPEDGSSLAGALEEVGLHRLGVPGSLFASAFVANAIDEAIFPRCGFSGLFFPVLEDSVLASRAGDGHVSVNDLLSYSAVCGAGVDTIPLAGDVSLDTVAGVLLDVAAMASRLDKPLTARLMPMPGLAAGDPVDIDFFWFAPSKAMALPSGGVTGHLQEQTRTRISAYHNRN